MGNTRPTIERRQLGLALKRFRKAAGKSQAEAATYLGCSNVLISKLEDGRTKFDTQKLRRLCDLYGLPQYECEIILALGDQARRRAQRYTYTDTLPGAFARFVDIQESAQVISAYQSGILPGLLQSPTYAQEIIDAGNGIQGDFTPDDVTRRVAFSVKHQEETWRTSDAKQFHFILGEAAIRDVVSTPDVMREQLAHLLHIMYTQPNASVQVLPANTPKNPARSGGFQLFDFDTSMPRVAYASVPYGPSTFIDDPEHTTALSRVFERLKTMALSQDETEKFILEQLRELRQA